MILLFITVVYMLLTRIFGHSATDLAVASGLFILLFTGLYYLFMNQYDVNKGLGELAAHMRCGFKKTKTDIGIIQQDVKIIQHDFKIIRHDFKNMQHDIKSIKELLR